MDCSPSETKSLPADALRYLAGGLSLVPCSPKTKRPENRLLPRDGEGKPTWACYQQQPADEATVKTWFTRGCESVAAIGGKVSGGLLIIDFDDPRFYPAWQEQVGSLVDGLPVQRTGREGGGFQVWLRCPDPGHNDKLAHVPDASEETGRRVAIETRGEGGYAVAPGSLHPSGRRYEVVAGDFAAIPTVPQAVADTLLAAARKLDEAPYTRQQLEAKEKAAKTSTKHQAESNGHGNVIDAYNAAVSIETALESHGYIRAGQRWKAPAARRQALRSAKGGASTIPATTPFRIITGIGPLTYSASWNTGATVERRSRPRRNCWGWRLAARGRHKRAARTASKRRPGPAWSFGAFPARSWTAALTTSNTSLTAP